MKRGSSSSFHTQKCARGANMIEDEQVTEVQGPTIRDLPIPILTKILLKLPLKETVFCKSVCKGWYSLIADTKYAKLHLSQMRPCTLIRALDHPHVSRILYLVEMPVVDGQATGGENFALNSKVKIPLRNAETVLNDAAVHVNARRAMKVKPKDHKLNIVNSCNGFICLSEPSLNDPVMVCNPVTGEFINLPGKKTVNMGPPKAIDCGFGFDPNTDEYKVIRMYSTNHSTGQQICCVFTGEMIYSCRVTEILFLGSGSWKNIGYAPPSLYNLSFPTYLNGNLHWLLVIDLGVFIASFDFMKEEFQSVPLPGQQQGGYFNRSTKDNISLGSLRGCLCVCDSSSCESLDIWVMKKYGDKESWSQDFTIDIFSSEPCLPMGLYQPLHYLTNGALLLFHPRKIALIYHDEKKWVSKYFKIQGIQSKFEAVTHIPSFMPLKDALKGNNVPVLKVQERCGLLKLFGETKSLYLEEDERFCTSAESSSDGGCYSP